MSSATGVRHEVDHIVPLKGKSVCGLHVPWNLRVIPERENRSKGCELVHDLGHLGIGPAPLPRQGDLFWSAAA
jgi:5-methylcytosine-specific restriction endonuclease McrA